MNRKNHNSLLFLTTLGVYLGLVLVGGTAPQVFAHSALTRNFEISDEIEVKDDLDTKPDVFSYEPAGRDELIEEGSFTDTVRRYLNGLKRSGTVSSIKDHDTSLFRSNYPTADYISSLDRSALSFDQSHFAVVSRLPRASIDCQPCKDAQ